MLNTINTWLTYILPHHALTGIIRWLTQLSIPVLTPWTLKAFIRIFRVDMSEAAEPDIKAYRCFDDFFTRALHPKARPFSPADKDALCPVDGTVSQLGQIEDGRLYQAKGIDYALSALMGGNDTLTQQFSDGFFITLYLSPRDYHRIHMPFSGTLSEMHYIPGRLFSVSPHSSAHVPGLFTRNERLITVFDSECGPMALILVGAMFVSGIDTVWSGIVTQGHSGNSLAHWDYAQSEHPINLKRGQEMGRFHMGSTVIVCLAKDRFQPSSGLQSGIPVRLGQSMGIRLQ